MRRLIPLAMAVILLAQNADAVEQGGILREYWSNITGTSVASLTTSPVFAADPTGRNYPTSFEAPSNWENNYGTRMRGTLHPTVSGTYQFWIAGDDNSQLWLSVNADPLQKQLIAHVPGWSAPRTWTKYPQQQSALVTLTAGQTYYIEALHKEGGGGDNLSVAWTGPGIGETPTIIAGNYLAPIYTPFINGNAYFTTSTTVTMSASVTGGTLYYTTDGSAPTTASASYSAPIVISQSTCFRVLHRTETGVQSDIVKRVFLRQGSGTGLTGGYFTNENISGDAIRRQDPTVNFNWGSNAPITGIANDHFSVRWQGDIETSFAQPYQLIARSDDGVRLWIDGVLVINDWTYHGAKDNIITLTPGRHSLCLEYKEGTGSAVMQLLWQNAFESRHAVPMTQLYPLLGVATVIPASSAVSPVYLEAMKLSDTTLLATVNGLAEPLSPLDATADYLNVSLQAAALTNVVITAPSGETASGDIAWTPTLLVGESTHIIRKNDSLLFEAPVDGSVIITNYSGTYLAPTPTTAGQRVPVQFTKPGEFTVRFLDAQGVEQGLAFVTVVWADLSQQVLSEVGYARAINLPVSPNNPPITFIGNKQLTVSNALIASDNAQVTITALQRGTPRLLARIHGPQGPLIATRTIDEFTINIPALKSAVVGAGTGIGTITLTMRPYIAHESFTMRMFAHTATFRGGVKKVDISTTGGPSSNGEAPFVQFFDETTQETIGVFRFDIEVPPNEDKYCFKVERRQEPPSPAPVTWLKDSRFILPVLAKMPLVPLALMMGETTGGETDGPTSNVNGDVCHVLAFKSLVFTQAVDSQEDEKNASGNGEMWMSRQWQLLTADYCEKEVVSSGTCNAVSYYLEVSDPPTFSGQLDSQLAALFDASRKDSTCKFCSGTCGPVEPNMDSGTIPGKYTTAIRICDEVSNAILGDAAGGEFYISKLDAHGIGSSTAKFPDHAEALKKRRGTVYDPVIQIDSGGDASTNGCGLYGWLGSPDCNTTNKWSFTAVARDPNDPTKNIPMDLGYSIKWKNIPGHENSTETSLVNVEFPVGRHLPRLEVWFTKPNPESGEVVVPVLVGVAEIHSLVVESSRGSNVGGKSSDMDPSGIRGAPFAVQNDAGGLSVDARLSITGGSYSRGRVSLDGYPQNEYWVTSGDTGDLAQVVTVKDSESLTCYLQGYNSPSETIDDLTLKCEGQALLESCEGCTLLEGNPVNASWQDTDTEKFTGISVISVVWVDDKEDPIRTVNNHSSGEIGYKWDPGAESPYSPKARTSIGAKLKLSLPIKDIPVFVTSADVDDPSKVDPDSTGKDNIGIISQDPLGMPTLTNEKGEIDLKYNLTDGMYPGDNYRLIGGLNQAEVIKTIDSNLVTPNSEQPPSFSGHISEMLTIWRALAVEIDSMDFKIPTDPPDAVKGTVLHSFITNPDALGSYVVQFTMSTGYDLFGQQYADGHFIFNNKDYKIIDNLPMSVMNNDKLKVIIPISEKDIIQQMTGQIVEYRDDDFMIALPATFPELSENVKSSYREAYIDIVNLPSDLNPNKLVPFDANLTPIEMAGFGSDYYTGWDIPSSNEYWSALVVMAYQGRVDTDLDPNSESALLGRTAAGLLHTSAIFLETIRDSSKNVVPNEEVVQNTIAHEVAHHVRLSHANEGILKAEPDLNEWYFDNETILLMRKTIKW